jgi:hypothetical protein
MSRVPGALPNCSRLSFLTLQGYWRRSPLQLPSHACLGPQTVSPQRKAHRRIQGGRRKCNLRACHRGPTMEHGKKLLVGKAACRPACGHLPLRLHLPLHHRLRARAGRPARDCLLPPTRHRPGGFAAGLACARVFDGRARRPSTHDPRSLCHFISLCHGTPRHQPAPQLYPGHSPGRAWRVAAWYCCREEDCRHLL